MLSLRGACEQCGAEFQARTRTQRFCSNRCFGDHRFGPADRTEKRCHVCRETKPLSEFNRMASARDGRRAYCRACQAEQYRQKRQLKPLEKRACPQCGTAFLGKGTKRFCSSQCRERSNLKARNSIFHCASCGKRVERYVPRSRVLTAADYYCSAECAENAPARRDVSWFFRLADLGSGDEPAEVFDGRYKHALYGDPCSYCGGPSGQIDHIEPRARGGADHWMNYTACCAGCNTAKHTKPLVQFMGYRLAKGYFELWQGAVAA